MHIVIATNISTRRDLRTAIKIWSINKSGLLGKSIWIGPNVFSCDRSTTPYVRNYVCLISHIPLVAAMFPHVLSPKMSIDWHIQYPGGTRLNFSWGAPRKGKNWTQKRPENVWKEGKKHLNHTKIPIKIPKSYNDACMSNDNLGKTDQVNWGQNLGSNRCEPSHRTYIHWYI